MSNNNLLAKARQHHLQARAIKDAFEGKAMPGEAAHEMQQHLDAAAGLRARAELAKSGRAVPEDELGYSVGLGDLDRKALPHFEKKELPPDASVKEHLGYGRVSDEACLNAFGWLVKAAISPTDPDDVVKALAHIGERKDMATSGSGGTLIPLPIAAFLIDMLRAKTACVRLGAQTVPMTASTLKVNRQTGDVTASWLNEAAAVTFTDAALDSVTLTARRVEAGTKVSMELAEDSSDPVSVGDVVANSIAQAFALEIDRVALKGTGTPPEPKGIKNTSGVLSSPMGTNGAAADWSTLVTWQGLLAQQNVPGSGFVMHPRTYYALAGAKDSTGQPVNAPAVVAALPVATTTALAINGTKGTGTNLAEAFAGNWSELMIGTRVNLSLQFLNELFRANGQIGIVGRGRFDVAPKHANSFVYVSDITN